MPQKSTGLSASPGNAQYPDSTAPRHSEVDVGCLMAVFGIEGLVSDLFDIGACCALVRFEIGEHAEHLPRSHCNIVKHSFRLSKHAKALCKPLPWA